MKITIFFFFVSSIALSTVLLAAPEDESVYQLAQGCYALQSPSNGDYLHKPSYGILLDIELDYEFDSLASSSASHFYLKPTQLGTFLLTDKDGEFLTGYLTGGLGVTSAPSGAAEWSISSSGNASNPAFSLSNRLTGQKLEHRYWKQKSAFFGLYKYWVLETEDQFNFVAQNDCTNYPEITVNVNGSRESLQGDIHDPIRGFADAHTHITSYEFMGGKVMHGDPFHPWGVPYALNDSREIHGPDGSLDLVGNLYTYGDINFRYDTRGWPDFPWWPNHRQLTHMGYYYKWIERAHLAGLRLMVAHLVENEVLCNIQSTINPASWVNPNSCNTMESIRLQAQRLYEMQDYIDAQSGGPGKGFFQIVASPEQAREVIAAGKTAVLMGVEASETFNCGLNDNCSIEKLEDGLNELYSLGIRTIFPAHKFDNHLSGSRVEDGLINVGQALSTGYFFETKACDEETKGARFNSGFPLIGDIDFISDILDDIGLNPEYDENIEHCNVHGLSDLGVYLINRMVDLNMIIDLDHLSADGATQVMDILEARQYSGVASSHSWMSSAKDGGLHRNTVRLIQSGGFVAPYNSDANRVEGRVSRYLTEIEKTGYWPGVGLGTDMSGLGGQAGPRNNTQELPLAYPFTSEFGLSFDKQVSGNRVFDLNHDGVAHYGMVADHIQDIRERASYQTYEAVMNSAEAYLQMWERAEQNDNIHYVNPL